RQGGAKPRIASGPRPRARDGARSWPGQRRFVRAAYQQIPTPQRCGQRSPHSHPHRRLSRPDPGGSQMTRKDAGLTLIELLITLALAAILLTLGVPAFSGTLERTRVSTTM